MKKRNNFRFIVLIFLVTLILLLKLLIDTRMYGHDTYFHTGNIIYLSKTISLTKLSGANIVQMNVNPFGYGTWLFYPKLPHLLAAYLYLLTKNIYLSMNIIYFITTFLSGVTIYYLSRKIFNNNRVAFLSAIIYLTSSYHICEIYTRDAFAENFMFLVIPLISLGLYELKVNQKNKFYLFFSLGYIIGIYSHLISMLFCTIFVLCYLIYFRKIFFKKDKLTSLAISMIIVTCITLPFLITILEHKLNGNYTVFAENFFNNNNIIENIIDVKYYFLHNKKENNGILVYINYSVISLVILTTVLTKKNKYKKIRKRLLFSLFALIGLINSKWLWYRMPTVLCTIQFSWRITTFLTLILSLYAPIYFLSLKQKAIYNLVYIGFVLMMIIEGLSNINYYGNKEYTIKEITTSINILGWHKEYLPYSINIRNDNQIMNKKYQIISDKKNAIIEIVEDKFPNMIFKVNNIKQSIHVILPRIYYLGYDIYSEKKEKMNSYESDSGFLETKIPNNGTFYLKYEGTIYEKIAYFIRAFTLIILALRTEQHIRHSKLRRRKL